MVRTEGEGRGRIPIMAQRILAVFTGDIVRSAKLPPDGLDRSLAVLEAGATEAWSWAGNPGGPRFTRFRGDGWQCLAVSDVLALRTALLLRARIRGLGRAFDTRISIGIGPGEIGSGTTLASASGPAFEVSGGGLDRIGRADRLIVGWSAPATCSRSIAAVFALADAISRRWTMRQAAVFARSLPPGAPSQEAIARDLGVTQQTVARHLAAGSDHALRQAIDALETRA